MTYRIVSIVAIVSILLFQAGCKGDQKSEGVEVKDKSATPAKAKAPAVDGSMFLVRQVPADLIKVDAVLENKIQLLGYTISATNVAPGDTVMLTWYWKCLNDVGGTWEYFTHFHDALGRHMGGVNSSGPMRSRYKPQMWKKGELIKDPERLVVPKNWSSPVLEVRTGLWQGSIRMAVKKGPTDPANRIKGPVLSVSVNAPAVVPGSQGVGEETLVPRAGKAPKIDGVIEKDNAWKGAVELKALTDTITGAPVPEVTNVKLMWDAKFLYVAMTAQDELLKSSFTKTDDELWKEDAFEMFVDPLGDGKDYFEIQASPAGVIFDSHLAEYRKERNDWSSAANLAVSVDGTLNDDEPDKGWSLELALPWKSLSEGEPVEFKEGLVITANFFRVDKGSQDTKYSGWSPPMRGDFHALERFGKLVLSSKK